jgi:hypothetical protein
MLSSKVSLISAYLPFIQQKNLLKFGPDSSQYLALDYFEVLEANSDAKSTIFVYVV